MSIWRNRLRAGVVLLYAAAMAYAACDGIAHPYRNWDMLGYVGSVVSWGASDDQSLYARTMAEAKAAVPDWIYLQYRDNPLSAEEKAFAEQLPFYQVKPLYNVFLWILSAIGFSLGAASWTVSAIAFAALAIFLFRWTPRHASRETWLLLTLALTFFGSWPMASLAHFSTPDALAAALAIAALYSLLWARSFKVFALLGWLAVLARPDALIFFCLFAAYLALLAPLDRRIPFFSGAGFALALLATYVAVSHFAHAYGWEELFVYSFVDKTPYPAEDSGRLTWPLYEAALASGAALFARNPRVVALFAFSAASLIAHAFRPAAGNRFWRDLLLVSWGTIAARFLLYPAWGEERYYYAYFLMILFAGAELISPALRERLTRA